MIQMNDSPQKKNNLRHAIKSQLLDVLEELLKASKKKYQKKDTPEDNVILYLQGIKRGATTMLDLCLDVLLPYEDGEGEEK